MYNILFSHNLYLDPSLIIIPGIQSKRNSELVKKNRTMSYLFERARREYKRYRGSIHQENNSLKSCSKEDLYTPDLSFVLAVKPVIPNVCDIVCIYFAFSDYFLVISDEKCFA